MTKNDLQQLIPIKKEIESLERQIDRVEMSVEHDVVTDSVVGSSPSFPYTQHSVKITGVDIKGYDKKVKMLRARLLKRKEELINQQYEMNKYIESIEDSEIRTILTLRYIEGLSWQQIADKLGVCGDGSTERKKHDRYLKFSRNS